MNTAIDLTGRSVAAAVWIAFVALLFYAIMMAFDIGQPEAHSWYPRECCHDQDCSVCDKVTPNPDGSFEVEARGKTVHVPSGFPEKQSKDGNYHICYRWYGNEAAEAPLIFCWFTPGQI